MMKLGYKKSVAANISLTTVLVTSAILLLTGITIVFSTMDLAYSSKDTFNYELNTMRSRSCLEEAIYRIKNNPTFTGTAAITFTDGNCSAAVTNDPQNSNIKLVAITSMIKEYTYMLNKKVDISTSPFTVLN
jgi:hypothetical protein